ncbi:MAG: hypothetical protein HZY79_02270 [Rhodoblastus sp.]|nr:MAG: hypothetical protein HZY79_02270 [Rhodoblastus sp.]
MNAPNLTRRAAIFAAGVAGATLAVPAIAATASAPDPLAALICEHDEATAYYNANAPEDDDLADAFADATFMPSFSRLIQDPPRPTTMAGVIAGLLFLLHEKMSAADAAPVLGVCLDFLRGSEA